MTYKFAERIHERNMMSVIPTLESHHLERFWAKVNRTAECWLWTGSLSPAGYGEFHLYSQRRRAHRIAYVVVRGHSCTGKTLDHLCGNRACVNPWHLEAVDTATNTLRGNGPPAINARKTHCKNGHEFSEENTRYSVKRDGKTRRSCRQCVRDSDADRVPRNRLKGGGGGGK